MGSVDLSNRGARVPRVPRRFVPEPPHNILIFLFSFKGSWLQSAAFQPVQTKGGSRADLLHCPRWVRPRSFLKIIIPLTDYSAKRSHILASVYPFRSWEKWVLSPHPHAPHLQWSEPSDPLKPPWPPQTLPKSSGWTRGAQSYPCLNSFMVSSPLFLSPLRAIPPLAHSRFLELRSMEWGARGHLHTFCLSSSARIAGL